MPTDRALAVACDHLFGDNFPSGAEVHVMRLAMLLDSERERAMREVIADVCMVLRVPDDEFDREHEKAAQIARVIADMIERQYVHGTRITRIL